MLLREVGAGDSEGADLAGQLALLLLVRRPDGTFKDRAKAFGIEVGGWTWNAKFADFDNDEWQDLYIANGFFGSKRRESNLYYRNLAGERFEDATDEVGLESHFVSLGWVAIDMEHDGDLDLVTTHAEAPVWLHRNRGTDGHAIGFLLRDERGNRFGIGSRVTIHYGEDGARHQMRELKLGGGYTSFDAPRLHFGLGAHDRVSRVEVAWSTGGTTTVDTELAAGHRYRIRRSH